MAIRAKILLDSGVGQLVLNRAFANTPGLAVDGSLTGVGVANQVQMETTKGVRIAFDNLSIDAPSAVLADLTELASAMREPIDALVGQDAFDALIVDIDFEHKRVAFRDLRVTPHLPGGTNLLLARGPLGRRRLPVIVGDDVAIPASFDLGAEAALAAVRFRQEIFATKRTSTALRAGISGPIEVEVRVIEKLTIGQMEFYQVPVEVPTTWALDCPTVVGIPILSRLRLIVDFPHDQVNVRSTAQLLNQPFQKDHSGIGHVA